MGSKYLEERAERLAEAQFKLADATELELKALFTETGKAMDKEVSSFYGKYGKVQSSPTFETLADGTKVLSGYTSKVVIPIEVALSKQGSKVSRIEKLNSTMNELVKGLTAGQIGITTAALKKAAETVYYDTIFTTASNIGVGRSFSLLTGSQITALIKNPLNGADFVRRTNINNAQLANRVNQTLRSGVTQGLSIKDMTNQLKSKVNMSYADSKRIIQTEMNNTMTQAAKESYISSGVVDEYKYIATLDKRTSSVCTNLDGQVFKVNKMIAGVNAPPMHPNCRSTTGAYFEDVEALTTRMARDENGNNFYVPANMNAKDFKAIYVDKTMNRTAWDKGNKTVSNIIKPPKIKSIVKDRDMKSFSPPDVLSNDRGTALDESFNLGNYYKKDYDSLDFATHHFMKDYNPNEEEALFFGYGFSDYVRPVKATGWRYGEFSSTGTSQNFATGNREEGVSLMEVFVDGKSLEKARELSDSQFGSQGRKKVWLEGYYTPSMWGGDGEPLMVLPDKIAKPK